ncbi:MAG: helix-turn-helix domain-containing protein [Cyanobacteriota bacterium]|nr:helix-turn-helix domain-containing protein [Cyanobacteriota bacterium]
MFPLANSEPHTDSAIAARQFEEIDGFAAALGPLNAKINQLTPGYFLGRVNWVKRATATFTYICHNQALRITGSQSSHQLVFGVAPDAYRTRVWFHGCPVTQQDLFGFNPTAEVDFILGKNASLIFVSIDASVFRSLAEQTGYNLWPKSPKQNLVRFHPASWRSLKAYYLHIARISSNGIPPLEQPHLQWRAGDDFLGLLVETLRKNARKNQRTPKPLRRYSLVKKAEELAEVERDRPLTLQRLCEELGTSKSALCYGFQETFEMSPMRYLKIRRLNGVRRALINADPQKANVMKIAHQWGFWSLGHFSGDYSQMFGELPSETLNR